MEAILDAAKRNTKGKNEARRLRAAGRLPAVVYGAQKIGDAPAPESVSVDPKPFLRILHSASGFNTLITLKVEGGGEARVLAKNVQLDPITHHPLHADFYRVNMDRKIKVTVPVILKGESRGVKIDGGVLDFVHREIEMEVLPANIPDSIEVDITNLGIGDSVHVRDFAGRRGLDTGHRSRSDDRPHHQHQGGRGSHGGRRRGGRRPRPRPARRSPKSSRRASRKTPRTRRRTTRRRTTRRSNRGSGSRDRGSGSGHETDRRSGQSGFRVSRHAAQRRLQGRRCAGRAVAGRRISGARSSRRCRSRRWWATSRSSSPSR